MYIAPKYLTFFAAILVCGCNRVEESSGVEEASDAKIFLRYSKKRSGFEHTTADHFNTQLLKLKSPELLRRVVRTIGSEKILGRESTGNDSQAIAVSAVQENLKVSRGTDTVILLRYHHPKPEIAQQVLKQLIKEYFENSLEEYRKNAPDIRASLEPMDPQIILMQEPTGPRNAESDGAGQGGAD